MRSLYLSTSLHVQGIYNGVYTGHDALYKWGADFTAGAGTPVLPAGTASRWQLGKGDSVVVTQEFPTTWADTGRSFQARLAWSKEAAGSGNVHWQLGYRFVYLVGGDFLAAKTVYDRGGVAVPGSVGGFAYLSDLSPNIDIARGQFFGDAPQVVFEVTRVNDATDTYAGDVGVYGLFFQRVGDP